MASGFKVNKQGIRKMTRELEREFAKNPVSVPLRAETEGVQSGGGTIVNNYHGPVVTTHGDYAQVAWANATVNQTQSRTEQVAPGFEELAELIANVLANLPVLALEEHEAEEAKANAENVLNEIVKEEPDQGVIKRGVTMLKGLLAPVAAGVSRTATEESAETARLAIEALGNAMPF